MKKETLREKMPETAALIDLLRLVFGKELIDEQIIKAKKGEPTFFACENGHQFGTLNTDARSCVQWDEQGRSFAYDIPVGTTFEAAREIQRLANYQANQGDKK